jgi:type IX secretion system PorP/SprF family membrane protein
MLLRRLLFTSWLIFILKLVYSQDPIFSQFHSSPLQLNPAFAGDDYNGRLAMNYRLQWPGLSAAYNTFSIGYDQFFRQTNLALGINILSDQAGDGALKSNKVSGILGYRLKINSETFIKGGIEIALAQKKLDWDKLVFYDAISASGGNITPGGSYLPSKEVEPANTNRSFSDIGTGLLLYNKKYFVGLSLDHMNTPIDEFLQDERQNYIGLPLRWSLHGGYQLPISFGPKNGLPSYISPNFLFTKQAAFNQLNIGINAALSQVFGGLGFRYSNSNGDAVIVSAGIRTEHLKIGYSFDFTISSLSISQGGAHELGLGYIFGESKKVSKINDCLNLFR